MKDAAYKKKLGKLLKSMERVSKSTTETNPSKSFLILFDGTEDIDRDIVVEYSEKLKKSGKKVKLLSYIHSKGELMDFGMAVYNNKSINMIGFPKKHIIELLESETFDVMFNLNVKNHKHLHSLACKAKADFKLSLSTNLQHNFTMILNTKEKENFNIILEEIDSCLSKLTF
jgi:hypothetical protein